MTGNVLHIDAARHKVADVLLPWFVNGTLSSDELEFVQQHLKECVRCQREVDCGPGLACHLDTAADGSA